MIGLTQLAPFVQKAKFLANENTHTILTGVGVAGSVTTAYLTGRASFKAAHILERETQRTNLMSAGTNGEALVLTKWSKTRLVWQLYIIPVGMGAVTVVSIIGANRVASRKIAALVVAGGISERALQEYKDKVIERLGERQDTKIRDEVAQDRINKHPVNSREVILAGTGEVLCYDMTTGRYFQSSVEEIKRAENKINHQLNNFMTASLSEFYDEIGLPATTFTDNVGWNANNSVEVQFSAVVSTDQRPCIAIDFVHPPFSDYQRTLYD